MKTTYTWKQLSLVQMGGVINSPILLVGYTLSLHFSFLSCLLIILLGNFIIAVIAYYYAAIFTGRGLSTVELALEVLGSRGGKICSIALFVTMIGWAALQTYILTDTVRSVAPKWYVFTPILMIGISCILCRKNLKLIAKFNSVIAPLLLCLLVFALYSSYTSNETIVSTEKTYISIKQSLCFIICTALGMVFDLPTFYENARSKKDTYLSVTLLFAVFLPIVELIGCALNCFSHNEALSDLPFLMQISSSKVFFFGFLLSGIGCNCINLFSSIVILHKSNKKISFNNSILISFVSTYLLYLFLKQINIILYLEIINSSIIILGSILIFYSIKTSNKFYSLDFYQKINNEIVFYFSLFIGSLLYFFDVNILGNILLDLIFMVTIILFVLSKRRIVC